MMKHPLTARERTLVLVVTVSFLVIAVSGTVALILASGSEKEAERSYREGIAHAFGEEGPRRGQSGNGSGEVPADEPAVQELGEHHAEGEAEVPGVAEEELTYNSVAGDWTVELVGTKSSLPGLQLQLSPNGGVTLLGVETGYLRLVGGYFNYIRKSREIKMVCPCEIQTTDQKTIVITFELLGTVKTSFRESTGDFTAFVRGSKTESGTYRMSR